MYELDADVYDALEFAAEVEGGVGSGMLFSDSRIGEHNDVAVCAYGLAHLAGIVEVKISEFYKTANSVADPQLKFLYTESDAVVYAYNSQKGRFGSYRIPFKTWVKGMGIIRKSN